jgi:hypothetical protein
LKIQWHAKIHFAKQSPDVSVPEGLKGVLLDGPHLFCLMRGFALWLGD